MRSFLPRIAILAGALSLAACGPMLAAGSAPGSAGSRASPAVDAAMVKGYQALIVAHNAYQAAAATAAGLIRADATRAPRRIPPRLILQAELLDGEAGKLLRGTGTGLTLAQRTLGMAGLTARMRSLIGSLN